MSVSLEALSSQAEEGELRQLNLIIKADVQGSLEAFKTSIEKIDSKDIPIKLFTLYRSINENDVLLAKASMASYLDSIALLIMKQNVPKMKISP